MTLLKFRRELTFGAPIPRGYRMAWYSPSRHVAIYYPAGSHLVFRWARELAYRIALMWNAPTREAAESRKFHQDFRERQRLSEEFASGFLAGWNGCFEACAKMLALIDHNDQEKK